MELNLIPIKKIIPLKEFSPHPNDTHGLYRLANSMRCHGMKLPLIVREEGQDYQLIDGHKRLYVWQYLQLGQNIPCIMVNVDIKSDVSSLLPFSISEPPSPKEKQQKVYDLYAMMALNLVRSQVNKDVLKAIVKYLHDEIGLGYGTIADRIGYSKAGVQRMLNRMAAEKSCADATNSLPGHSLRRLRTELKRLRETVPPMMDDAADVTEAIQRVHEYIDSLLVAS